jgi:uncharacterized DUF497 family protein
MPYHEFFWTEEAVEKIIEHGLTIRDVEFVVLKASKPVVSNSSGRPAYIGRTTAGSLIIVVFEKIDDTQILVITAYPIERQ